MHVNPFVVGRPVTGQNFYDRVEILRELSIFDAKSYYLNGVRRIGKSSLLRQLEQQLLLNGNYLPLYCPLQGHTQSESMGKDLARKIQMLAALKKIPADDILTTPGLLEDVLTNWTDYCRRTGNLSFILLDEAEQLLTLQADNLERLTRIFDTNNDVLKVIVAGTRRFFQLAESSPAAITLSQMFTQRYIGHIDPDAAQHLVSQSQNDHVDVSPTPDHLKQILDYCGGHPYLIQFVCDSLFDPRAGKLNTIAHLGLASNTQLNNYFKEDFNSLDQTQQHILLQLSAHGALSAVDLFKSIRVEDSEGDSALNELLNLGLICQEKELFRIGYLFLSDWLKTQPSMKRQFPDLINISETQKQILIQLGQHGKMPLMTIQENVKSSKKETYKALQELVNLGIVREEREYYSIGELSLPEWVKSISAGNLPQPGGDSKSPKRIHISFAPSDRNDKGKLLNNLRTLERQQRIEIWDEDLTPVGEVIEDQIRQSINIAHILIFLVSTDFNNFERAQTLDLPHALERKTNNSNFHIVPIILRQTYLEGTYFSSVKVLPDNGKSIQESDNEDAAWVDIVKAITKLLE